MRTLRKTITLVAFTLVGWWSPAAFASPHGGSGGTAFNQGCGAGAVLVGLQGGAGAKVDRIQLVCAKVRGSDGTLENQFGPGGQFGGSGGTYYFKTCPSGQAVVGIKGRVTNVVDQLELGCGKVQIVDGKIKIPSVGPGIGAVGGNTGTPFLDLCPAGEMVLGLSGRSGSMLDQIDRTCGTLDALPFAVTGSVSPSSTSSQYLDCNTALTFTANAFGANTASATQYRFMVFRMLYNGSQTAQDAPVFTRDWDSSKTAAWTPTKAGSYRMRAEARNSGVEVRVAPADYARVFIRLGMQTTMSPPSPASGPTAVAMSSTATCAPDGATVFYTFGADSTNSGYVTSSSWSTPSLAAGSHSLRSQVLAMQGSSATYDGTKLVALADGRTHPYTVGGGGPGAKFSDYLAAKHKHEKCVTCHTFTDNQVRTDHINASRITSATDVTKSVNCTNSTCHTAAQGYPPDWKAATPAARWTAATSDLDICNLIKNHTDTNTNATMLHHLTHDGKILWALGRMGVANPEWTEKSTAWTNNNRLCQ